VFVSFFLFSLVRCLFPFFYFFSLRKVFYSIIIYWSLLVPVGVPVLVSFFSSLVPVLVSLLSFFSQDRNSILTWFVGSSWFWLGFRCLFSFFSLFLDSDICLPSYFFFFSSGKGFCSIMIYWFRLDSGDYLPFFLFFSQERDSILSWMSWILFVLAGSGVPFLFYQEKGFIPLWISYFLLVQAAVPVLVSLLFFFLCVPNNHES
jgi:hypothetical protein